MDVEKFVRKAQDGNKDALESVVIAIQDNIYFLALRMLANPEDAKDATQEIIIRVITKLSTFQFNSAFNTWVYRVASNYLLDTKKAMSNEPELSFDDFQNDLEQDLEDPAELEQLVEYPLLLNEVRISCTMAMLLCLNKKHRMAYILGDIFELGHYEASQILSISKANYRKQLSRARKKVVTFTTNSCGLVSEQARCTCRTKLKGSLRRTHVDQTNIKFAKMSELSYPEIQQKIEETQGALKTMALQKAIPTLHSPESFGELMETLLTKAFENSNVSRLSRWE